MNNIDVISGQNQSNVTGTVSICKKASPGYVGRDKTYEFGKNIQLPTGDFLKVAHKDLMYRVEIITNLPGGGQKVEHKELPSCLFTQARKGDTICYKEGAKNYEFQLVPHLRFVGVPPNATVDKVIPFDECVKCVEALAKNDSFTDFYSVQDVPYENGYEGRWVLVNGNRTFHTVLSPVDGGIVISRSGKPYSLSPETKRIHLGQIGVSPCNFEELQLVNCETGPADSAKHPHQNGITITIGASGADLIEILLDGNQLYVTQKPNEGAAFIGCTFYRTTLESGSKVIDGSKIFAQLDDAAVLRIVIPFMTIDDREEISDIDDREEISDDDEMPINHTDTLTTSTTSTTSATTTSSVTPVSTNTTPLPTTVYFSVDYNVGSGNTLGVCCEPSWADAPIAFVHNGTDWSGQVPVGKEWKFVILQNGHITKWENGNNRRCDGNVTSFTLTADKPKFG